MKKYKEEWRKMKKDKESWRKIKIDEESWRKIKIDEYRWRKKIRGSSWLIDEQTLVTDEKEKNYTMFFARSQ